MAVEYVEGVDCHDGIGGWFVRGEVCVSGGYWSDGVWMG